MLPLLAALLAIGAFAAACGGGDGDETIDTPDGEVTVGDDLPDDFPDELMYDGADVVASISGESDGDEATFVTLETDDSTEDVQAYYEGALEDNGWDIQTTSNTGGTSTLIATKDNTGASITIGEGEDGTSIQISYGDTDTGDDGSGDDGSGDDGSGDDGSGDDGSGDDGSGDDGSGDDGSGDDGSSGESDLPDEVEVEDEFPDNIELPSGLRVTGSSAISAGGQSTVFVEGYSDQSVEELRSHFEDALGGAGYEEALASTQDGDAYLQYNVTGSETEVVIISIQNDSGYEGYRYVTITASAAAN
jgi:hypothetical protein